jgi:hypothetical protein
MSMRMIFLFFIFITLTGGQPSFGESQDADKLYNIELEKMDSFAEFSTRSLVGSKSVWILFEPECNACQRQFSDLSCLKDSAIIVRVGFKGTKNQLRKMVLKKNIKTIDLQSNGSFENRVRLKQTPTLLFADESGIIRKRKESYTPCFELKKILAKI